MAVRTAFSLGTLPSLPGEPTDMTSAEIGTLAAAAAAAAPAASLAASAADSAVEIADPSAVRTAFSLGTLLSLPGEPTDVTSALLGISPPCAAVVRSSCATRSLSSA